MVNKNEFYEVAGEICMDNNLLPVTSEDLKFEQEYKNMDVDQITQIIKEKLVLLSGNEDIMTDSRWSNIIVDNSNIQSIGYIGDNHIILTTNDKTQHELIGFAATKLLRMVRMKKSQFELEDTPYSASNKELLEKIMNRSDVDKLVLRTLKEDGTIMSVVGSTYVPIDMEVLETEAEQIIENMGLEVKNKEIHKTTYARGLDKTRYVFTEQKRVAHVGDVMSIGLQIRNNELGTRSMGVALLMERLACSNGMVSYDTEQVFDAVHLGNEQEILDRFKKAVVNIIDSAWDILKWINILDDITLSMDDMISFVDKQLERKLISKKIAKRLTEVIKTGDYGTKSSSAWGLVNAFTGVASHGSADGVKDTLERIASDVMSVRNEEELFAMI